MVSELEERDAARFNGYTWHDWRELFYADRADGVAYYRISRLIDMHREDAVASKVQENQTKG
jgi:hypothetical protein